MAAELARVIPQTKTADDFAAAKRRRTALLVAMALVAAALAGALIASLPPAGRVLVVGALLWSILPALVWRWPASGVVVLMGVALTLEQFPVRGVGGRSVTEMVQVFTSFNSSSGVSGIFLNPAEILMGTVAVTWIVLAVARREASFRITPLAGGVAGLLVLAVIAEVHGLAAGGDLKASLWELRPFVYLTGLFLLAAVTVQDRRWVLAMPWVLVLGSGFKAVEGCLRFLGVRYVYPRPASILEHEEAVFFGLFILVTGALWALQIRGRLRQAATLLLPFVIVADLVNDRRTAWLILPATAFVLLAVCLVRYPKRRARILAVSGGLALVAGVYLLAFWSSSSTVAKPAAAIRSSFTPSSRDASSNLYRQIEDLDLGIQVHKSFPLGAGFGRPLVNAVPLPDLSSIDKSIAYVPHNGVLYLWLRTGLPGAAVFWWVIGLAIIAAGRLARSPDARVALFATVVISAVVAYVIEGWYDQGLMSFRVSILLGSLLGALEALRRLEAQSP